MTQPKISMLDSQLTFDEDSLAALKRLAAWQARGYAATRFGTILAGRRLKSLIREEFQPHNNTGASIKTLSVRTSAMVVRITMGGGMPYVEDGFPPHVIPARTEKLQGSERRIPLHWEEGGQDYFAMSVDNPGYKGDDFVGRALDRLDINEVMAGITERLLAPLP
ncbi:MAG: hypothetical protein ACRDFS_11720 [Chloroflexota bacterium]